MLLVLAQLPAQEVAGLYFSERPTDWAQVQLLAPAQAQGVEPTPETQAESAAAQDVLAHAEPRDLATAWEVQQAAEQELELERVLARDLEFVLVQVLAEE